MQRYFFSFAILKTTIHFQNLFDLTLRYWYTMIVLDGLLNIMCTVDWLMLGYNLVSLLHDKLIILLSCKNLLVILPQVVWVLLYILQQGPYWLSSNLVSTTNVVMVVSLHQDIHSHINLFFYRHVSQLSLLVSLDTKLIVETAFAQLLAVVSFMTMYVCM